VDSRPSPSCHLANFKIFPFSMQMMTLFIRSGRQRSD
jgi:hypothetical protein